MRTADINMNDPIKRGDLTEIKVGQVTTTARVHPVDGDAPLNPGAWHRVEIELVFPEAVRPLIDRREEEFALVSGSQPRGTGRWVA